ncbi:J domain-containing protein [Synechococcus sp. PCC 6717]|nr:J domain-containing protein [Synechococcus sp. PCC 6717]
MLNLEEYWKVLELTPDASIEEIKLAYRRLVRRWHPDLYPHDSVLKTNAEENIKKINIAYEKLLEYKDQQCQAISDSTTSSSGDLSVQTRATGAVEFYSDKHHVWLSSSDDGTLRLWELPNPVESTFWVSYILETGNTLSGREHGSRHSYCRTLTSRLCG